jgi:hypothetical protein
METVLMKSLLPIAALFVLSGLFTMGSGGSVPRTCIIASQNHLFTYYAIRDTASNKFFDIEIIPSRDENASRDTLNGFNTLSVTVKNNTNNDIEIDWSKSLLIISSRKIDGLKYEEIAFSDNSQPTTPDIVKENSTLVKSIMPNSKQIADRKDLRFSLTGDIVVYLVLKADKQEFIEKLQIVIERVESNSCFS